MLRKKLDFSLFDWSLTILGWIEFCCCWFVVCLLWLKSLLVINFGIVIDASFILRRFSLYVIRETDCGSVLVVLFDSFPSAVSGILDWLSNFSHS